MPSRFLSRKGKSWRLFFGLLVVGVACLQNEPLQARQELLFSDEFKDPKLHLADWQTERRSGGGQVSEKAGLQFYLPEAVSLVDGVLLLTAQKAQSSDPAIKNHFTFTSGCVQSKHEYLYGKFEFRVRLPKGAGLWPSISLRTPDPKPFKESIEVVEGFGAHPNMIQSTLRTLVAGGESRSATALLVVRAQPDSPKFHKEGVERVEHLITLPRDLSEDYHVYAVEWQPDHITWMFDGLPYFTVKERVPKEPLIINMQLALSNTWDGKPDGTLELPQSLEVDYVRIWGGQR